MFDSHAYCVQCVLQALGQFRLVFGVLLVLLGWLCAPVAGTAGLITIYKVHFRMSNLLTVLSPRPPLHNHDYSKSNYTM